MDDDIEEGMAQHLDEIDEGIQYYPFEPPPNEDDTAWLESWDER